MGCNKTNRPAFAAPCSGGQCSHAPKSNGDNCSGKNLHQRKHGLVQDGKETAPLSSSSSTSMTSTQSKV
eukprot:jgi/Psemu1/304899/fgenesh1_kg.174_\